jgi:hypothetical protein
MFQTYFLEKYPIQSNAYTVSRSETWSFRKDRLFDDLEEAEEYIRNKNRYTPEFVLQAEGVTGPQREELLDRFSFTNEYLMKRRYFIDPLPRDEIKKAILDAHLILE